MMYEPICDTQVLHFVNQPKYSWKVEIAPTFFVYVQDGRVPNVFNRFMQRLCLGFKWSRTIDCS